MCRQHPPTTPRSLTSTVLVVDDLPFNRKLLSALAHKLGFKTEEAVNGAEALAMLAKYQQQLSTTTRSSASPANGASSSTLNPAFACVLLDLQMPVLDGWSTARQVRQMTGDISTLPIIACTACNLEEASSTEAGLSIEQQTLACGIDLCLTKPFKLEQLVAALEQLSVPCPASSLSRSSSASSILL